MSAGAAPSGKLPLDGEIAQQNKSGSGVADHKPSETETPSSLLEGAKQAVNTTPPDVYNRGAESMNETDEEERCSSSGEAWEEVGAAKRRKDRRRRLEDKVRQLRLSSLSSKGFVVGQCARAIWFVRCGVLPKQTAGTLIFLRRF